MHALDNQQRVVVVVVVVGQESKKKKNPLNHQPQPAIFKNPITTYILVKHTYRNVLIPYLHNDTKKKKHHILARQLS